MLSFLEDHSLHLLFFGGKGGVGKTTCATATALQLARAAPGASILLLSADPAHSLRDSLASLTLPANLTVREPDARRGLERFRSQHRGKLREIALRGTFLDEDDLDRFLDLSLPGLDELMALLEICRIAANQSYDTMVVDTAPTGHTLRLLLMPGLLHRWLEALDTLLAKHRFMKRRFNGGYRPDDLDTFVSDLAGALTGLEDLLQDPKSCRFVPVMLAEEMVVQETLSLLHELQHFGVPVTEIVVNRLLPASSCPGCSGVQERQREIIEGLLDDGSLAGYALWGVPFHRQEVRGRSLVKFWRGAERLAARKLSLPSRLFSLPPRVEGAPALPSRRLKFLFFAGKGGVGKTTLACATAVRLARSSKGKDILLISTDPAHSLSQCLGTPLGPAPTRVMSGLMALEMDPAGEFARLRGEFRRDLERLLEAVCGPFDLPFDREVLEQLINLSPPGLDEVIALTRALDFWEQDGFDLFILDSAPTGHLVRLLELPEIMDQWLKGFFGVLLKYRLAQRLPEFSRRLVKISRGLKYLRQVWCDPHRTAVYGVAALTEMALEETKDLVAACQRLGMKVPVLFLNLASPEGHCPTCIAVRRQESRLQVTFQREFKDLRLARVYRQEEPRGLKRLLELGRRLYGPRLSVAAVGRPARTGMRPSPPAGRTHVPPFPG